MRLLIFLCLLAINHQPSTINRPMASIKIDITRDTNVRGSLSEIRQFFSDERKINEAMGQAIVYGDPANGSPGGKGLIKHFINAAPSRHKTAEALGVKPTELLNHLANAIEIQPSSDGVKIIIGSEEASGGILKRAEGDVTIVPNRRSWLCIPVQAKTHNTSPLNWPGQLVFIPSKQKDTLLAIWKKTDPAKALAAALEPVGTEKSEVRGQRSAKPAKPKKAARSQRVADANGGAKLDIAFVLKKRVTLPKDEGLLPTQQEFYDLAQAGLLALYDKALNESGPVA